MFDTISKKETSSLRLDFWATLSTDNAPTISYPYLIGTHINAIFDHEKMKEFRSISDDTKN